MSEGANRIFLRENPLVEKELLKRLKRGDTTIELAEYLKTTLESFGVALLQLELKEDSILIDTHIDILSRCDAAILIHDESDIQDIHLVNSSDAREGAIYLLGAVTSNYGNRVIFLREQGLEAFKQESYIKAIEFNQNSVQEASLNVLQSLYSMNIIKVQT